MTIKVIGLDLAKNVFQVHGADEVGQSVLKRKLRRSEVLRLFSGLEPALVGIEACHTAHYWGREIAALGHEVRLMPPQFVKPYVKSQKNDTADAEAICEAGTSLSPPTQNLTCHLCRRRSGRECPAVLHYGRRNGSATALPEQPATLIDDARRS